MKEGKLPKKPSWEDSNHVDTIIKNKGLEETSTTNPKKVCTGKCKKKYVDHQIGVPVRKKIHSAWYQKFFGRIKGSK